MKLSDNLKFVLICARNRPSWLFNNNMAKKLNKRGKRVRIWRNKCLAMCWNDNKPVCMFLLSLISFFSSYLCIGVLTNAYSTKPVKHVSTSQSHKTRQLPTVIDKYNKHKGGVDLADMYAAGYLICSFIFKKILILF